MPNEAAFCRPNPSPEAPVKPPRLDVYMPATPPLGLLAAAEFWLTMLVRRHRFRGLFRPLLNERDQILTDIGLNRRDMEWALALPLRVDALKALADCSKAREAYEKAQDGTKHEPDGTTPQGLSCRPG